MSRTPETAITLYPSPYSTSANNFLDKFPEWAEIFEDDDYDDRWVEEDHNLFKEALEWLVEQPIGFIVEWSF